MTDNATAADYQLSLRFSGYEDFRPTLKQLARAEDRSVQSLLRTFISEGIKSRLRAERLSV